MDMGFDEAFGDLGYAVTAAVDRAPLERLRARIHQVCVEATRDDGRDPAAFFNHFHELGITGARLNALRMAIIRTCTEQIDAGAAIFEAFREPILRLVGPDLLVQKTTNLVIQQPGDPDPSELHRDVPGNSVHEVVVWVPLVDCHRTKSMYILDRGKTMAAESLLRSKNDDWEGFEAHCLEQGRGVDVAFGEALFFWTGLYHGSRVNREAETRFSLNIRYKGLFSPGGLKDPFEYFRVLRLSPLARLGIDHAKKQLLP